MAYLVNLFEQRRITLERTLQARQGYCACRALYCVIRSLCQRLRNAGKAPKAALVACMRKLLTILNAMIEHKTRWSETILQTS